MNGAGTAASFNRPFDVAADALGNIYVADGNNVIVRKITPVGVVSTFAGMADAYSYDNFYYPTGVATDAAGNVYVADGGSSLIRKITPAGLISTLAGSLLAYGSSDGAGTAASFNNPFMLATDALGNVYVTDLFNQLIRKVSPAGVVSTFAGSLMAPGSSNGTGTAASFYNPHGIATDHQGNVYVADGQTNLIRKITPSGVVSTLAGSGSPGSANGVGAMASFYSPIGLAIDPSDNLYVADENNNLIRKVTLTGYTISPALPAGLRFDSTTGIISGTPTSASPATTYTVTAYNAGGSSTTTFSLAVQNIPPPTISYTSPQTYTVNAAITPLTPNSSGVGMQPFSTPVAVNGNFKHVTGRGLAVDAAGNIYASQINDGELTEIPAGGGAPVSFNTGVGGDVISNVAVDASGNVYFSTVYSNIIKKIPAGGNTAVALTSGFSFPNAVGTAKDAAGNCYTADYFNGAIEEIPVSGASVTLVSAINISGGIAASASGNIYYNTNNGLVNGAPSGDIFELKRTGEYTISPALPSGLTFDRTTGTISGTPTTASPATNYTVTAYNAGGSTKATFSLAVQNAPPPTISYNSPQSYTVNTSITALTPSSSGVAALGYSNSPVSIASGFSSPQSVAIDAAGNLYVADYSNKAIKKIPAGGGSPVNIDAGYYSFGVAVDAAGNVYVSNNSVSTIKKIPAGNGSPVNIATGLNDPRGVAVDAAGNVYVAEAGNSTVVKFPYSAGSYGSPISLGSGFYAPQGIAVDAAGNIYVADKGNNAVKKIPAGGGSVVTLGSGFNLPSGVAADAFGNIFVADIGDEKIKELRAAGGDSVVLASGIIPTSITLDAAGNLYFSESITNAVEKIKLTGGYTINPALPAGLSFNNATGAINGTPIAVTAAANYTVTAYNAGGSSTATLNITVKNIPPPTITYSSPQSYTVNTAIIPLVPTSNGVAAPTYSNTPVTLGSEFSNPEGVAVDRVGNVYVADYYNSAVYKVPYSNGTYGSPIALGFGFKPAGVAVDAAGNVYVGDFGNSAVKKIPYNNGTYGTPISIGSGFSYPQGVAVDVSGNVYVADYYNNAVKKIPYSNGVYGTPIPLGSGFVYPFGVAVDASGNVFVADPSNNAVEKIPYKNGTYGNPITIGSGFTDDPGVAVDSAGNIYVSDNGHNMIKEIPYNGGNYSNSPITLVSGLNHTLGVAVDASGNVYFSNTNNSTVEKLSKSGGYSISPALPAGLSFSGSTGTISGTPIAVSPATTYTVTAVNQYGSGTASFTLLVNPTQLPVISYAGPQTYTRNKAVTPLIPTNTGSAVAANGYSISPALPAGLTLNSTGTISGTPTEISPTTTYTVTATNQYGSSTATVNIAVVVPPSSNTVLTNVTISTFDKMNGAFVNGLRTISTTVSPSVTSASFTPVTQDPNATVTINGVPVADGTASALIPLNANAVTNITLVVTAADGVTKTVYPIVVNRGPSSNTILTGLAASNGAQLTGASVNGLWTFTASVGASVSSLTFTPTTLDPNAKVTINGIAVADNTASAQIAITANSSNKITLVVTAADGVTTQTYPIIIYRSGASGNTAITSLIVSTLDAISGASVNGLWSFSTTVLPSVSQLSFTPVTADAGATVTINGISVADGGASSPFTLNASGSTTFTMVVTAADGITQQIYPITINKSTVSSNTALTGLLANNGVSLSGAEVNGYWTLSGTAGASVSSLSFTPTTADPNAKVTINGTAVADKTASSAIAINASGTTNITLIVTASDGVTKQTYPIVITKLGTNASLRITNVLPDIFKTDSTVVANNILSPNGDGVNDTWTVRNIDLYPNNSVTVYDRIGHVVFTKKGYASDWAGTYGGSVLNQGTYYYLLDLGNGTLLKGFITVVRDR